MATVEDAARNNAELCSLVAGGGRFADDAWTTPARTPPLFPDAVTLRPGSAAREILHEIEPGPGCSVKDSFADLDLGPFGFEILFSADWIHRPAGLAPPADARPWTPVVDEPGLALWPQLTPLLGHADVRFVARAGSGAVLNGSATCVGVSNVVTADGTNEDDAWAAAVAAASRWCPDLPIVGYESGDDLATAQRHGFSTIGPLRVWIS